MWLLSGRIITITVVQTGGDPFRCIPSTTVLPLALVLDVFIIILSILFDPSLSPEHFPGKMFGEAVIGATSGVLCTRETPRPADWLQRFSLSILMTPFDVMLASRLLGSRLWRCVIGRMSGPSQLAICPPGRPKHHESVGWRARLKTAREDDDRLVVKLDFLGANQPRTSFLHSSAGGNGASDVH